MKLTCPNNPEHTEFSTTAHVSQEWIVDEYGEFLREAQHQFYEVLHSPDADDVFYCLDCGAEAKVVADDQEPQEPETSDSVFRAVTDADRS